MQTRSELRIIVWGMADHMAYYMAYYMVYYMAYDIADYMDQLYGPIINLAYDEVFSVGFGGMGAGSHICAQQCLELTF